jgi:hypothetical protein
MPVSQLEVATLAFAISAISTYLINWWRPKDVLEPAKLQALANGAIAKGNAKVPKG